ncbi:hypothetical protein NL676_020392 [Syzygium grande]|nr:hypothetical protein NL676_020392 [Syzygium grande]
MVSTSLSKSSLGTDSSNSLDRMSKKFRAGSSIRIEVEEGEVGQEAELLQAVPSNVAVVGLMLATVWTLGSVGRGEQKTQE